ncbi:lytic murein transglycosylase [Pseudosulfitobacter koreensis]|uniref:Lytic murein transglycosylase n=1 Tax=Pseudosulfitobacter koreensis TaxID=2968472 RepID=A0ABT1YVQ9_9RHOB|nr:lytic murein transglycosylase [Pseudosulfitobacter koreense]MCR8824971.1 lytic murein transglycosylase [Pseudosulfitobacter koreense]
MLRLATLALSLTLPMAAFAQCGGAFSEFKSGLKAEAVSMGIPPASADAFLSGVRQDASVLRADQAQGVFQKPFIDFSRHLISSQRLNKGQQLAGQYDSTFDRIETTYGVDRSVLLAFWAFETDYGAFQGDFNTANALATLAHDCRRPELFRPQVLAAMRLHADGQFDPRTTTGAWAGEIGMVQMLPQDIIENGVDADGNGRVDLKTSATDALHSGGKMLQHLGWQAGQPWLQEVTVPTTMDWAQSGLETVKSTAYWQALGVAARNDTLADLPASLILPQGHKGPAFLAYPNFNVYFEWNQSFTYVLTAAYFATRLGGAPIYDAGNPDTGLDSAQMKRLQHRLQDKGYDVGDIDGILGAGTRAAVKAEQQRLGLPADAWPTPALLNQI